MTVLIMGLFLIGLPLFAGGQQSGSGTTTATGIDVVTSRGFGTSSTLANDPIQKFIEDKFKLRVDPVNVDVTMDGDELWQLLAMSGDLPGFWFGSLTGYMGEWVGQGYIKNLPYSLISKYPAVKQKVDNSVTMQFYRDKFDGQYLFIPRPDSVRYTPGPSDTDFYYRRDWAAKIGYPNRPKDMEEFYQILYAFTYNDPDGNGRNDTHGLAFAEWGEIIVKFGGTLGWMTGPDGKAIPGYLDEKTMIPALTWLRKAWDNKVIDPEWTGDYNQKIALFSQGIYGATTTWMAYYKKYMTDPFQSAQPGVDYVKAVDTIGPVAAPDGKSYHGWQGDGAMITFSSDVSDTALDKVLALMEWVPSDEANALLRWGIKDVDYRVNANGSFTAITPAAELWTKYPAINMRQIAQRDTDYNTFDEPTWTAEEHTWAQAWFSDLIPAVRNYLTYYNWPADALPNLDKASLPSVSPMLLDIIMGTGDVTTMYRQFTTNMYAAGLQKVIDSVNAGIK
jgi:hypothetical protein